MAIRTVPCRQHFQFSYTKIANLLPQWKHELVFLKDAPSQTLQQSLKNLESSFRNFFAKRADFPNLKIKGMNDKSLHPMPRLIRVQATA